MRVAISLSGSGLGLQMGPYWLRYGPGQLLDNLVGDIGAGSLIFRTLAFLCRRPDYVTIAID